MDCLMWMWLLVFLGGCGDFGKCQSVKEQRLQRRFMWRQMDDTMDGIMDGMANSARAMKSMFFDLMPNMQSTQPTFSHSNGQDYLPSETTRVKYIIHNPPASLQQQSVPRKMLKLRAPKKVVKLMGPTSSKHVMEIKPKKLHFNYPHNEEMRKLEKEQEMMVEGRLPLKGGSHPKGNDIYSGKIQEFGNEWTPVQAQLHTSIVGDKLPEAEQQVYAPEHNKVGEESKQPDPHEHHDYEVTEFAAEESVALPLTHSHQPQSPEYPSARYQSRIGQQPTLTTTQRAVTTTELPNYPSAFLHKFRTDKHALLTTAPPVSKAPPKFKASMRAIDHIWQPTNVTHIYGGSHKAKPKIAPQQAYAEPLKREKWLPGPFVTVATTDLTLKSSFPTPPTTTPPPPLRTPRKSAKLKALPTAEYKPRDIRQRGSVKFGDKLNFE